MIFKKFWILLLYSPVLLASFKNQDMQDVDYLEKVYLDKTCNCFVKETYWNGIKSTYEQVKDTFDFILQGKFVSFYENGDTAAVTIYKDYKKEGPYYSLYPGGRLWEKGIYLSDKKEDVWIYLKENGDTVSMQHFVKDKEHGERYITYERGYQTFREYASYAHGNRNGTWKTYVNNVLAEQTVYDRAVPGKYAVQYYDTVSGGLIYTVVHVKGRKDTETINNQNLYQQMQWRAANRTGEELFMVNCASCHHPYHDATGPALSGVTKRYPEQWIRTWIKNPAALIASGDAAAVATYHKWNKTAMTAFPNVPVRDMDKLIAYLKSL